MANSPTVDIGAHFETTASERVLLHKGKPAPLDPAGKGTLKVVPGEYDLILFVYHGAPGTKAKITLTPPNGYELKIAGHPIEDQIAQDKQLSGDHRFFRVVKTAS